MKSLGSVMTSLTGPRAPQTAPSFRGEQPGKPGSAVALTSGEPLATPAEAQALLETAKPGQVDAAIQAWLPLSVRSRIVEKHYDGPNDPLLNYSVVGYELEHGFSDRDGQESLLLMEMLNTRASPEDCQKWLARLKMMTAARSTGQDDLVAQIAIYADELSEYPADVVRDVCRWWAAREKWFPTWAELRQACDERVMKRRAILMGLRRYFSNKEQTE